MMLTLETNISQGDLFNSECQYEPLCLKCGANGCVKCPQVISLDERRCLSHCPNGYAEQWSTVHDFMGRVCQPLNLTGSILTTTIGVLLALFLIALIILLAVVITKKQRKENNNSSNLTRTEYSISRNEFLRDVDELRPNAEYFLYMLNDTRRQVRKYFILGDEESAQRMKPILQDLAKILILINRPIELISNPPPDWSLLNEWAKSTIDQQKQRREMVDLLQHTPDNQMDVKDRPHFYRTTLQSIRESCEFQQELPLTTSLINLHDPPSSVEDSSLIWLEDEIMKFGLRPQDEITTEL